MKTTEEDFGEAMQLFEKVQAKHPASLPHIKILIEVYSSLQYDEILRVDPSSAQAYAEKGWTLISLRDYEEALATFDRALQYDPSAHSAEIGKDFVFTYIFRIRLWM